MSSNHFLIYSGGPFIEVRIALHRLGVYSRKQRDEVLTELGIPVIRIGDVEFLGEADLNRRLNELRAKVMAAAGAAQ